MSLNLSADTRVQTQDRSAGQMEDRAKNTESCYLKNPYSMVCQKSVTVSVHLIYSQNTT